MKQNRYNISLTLIHFVNYKTLHLSVNKNKIITDHTEFFLKLQIKCIFIKAITFYYGYLDKK